MTGSDPEAPAYDRTYLLLEGKRHEVLTLDEVRRFGRDSFGDPDYVSVYGLKPAEWYARGVRLLARTAVECTRDELVNRIGRDVASVAGSLTATSDRAVVDPFAGSGNTLYWLQRHLSATRVLGFEIDDGVFRSTRKTFPSSIRASSCGEETSRPCYRRSRSGRAGH